MNKYGEKINNLKKQQKQAKELFIKLQGAIEMLESMAEENESPKKDEKKENKQFFEIK